MNNNGTAESRLSGGPWVWVGGISMEGGALNHRTSYSRTGRPKGRFSGCLKDGKPICNERGSLFNAGQEWMETVPKELSVQGKLSRNKGGRGAEWPAGRRVGSHHTGFAEAQPAHRPAHCGSLGSISFFFSVISCFLKKRENHHFLFVLSVQSLEQILFARQTQGNKSSHRASLGN